MPTNDKDKRIIRPDDPEAANFDNVPRPNPSRNTASEVTGTPPGRPTPVIRAGAPAPNIGPDHQIEPPAPNRPTGRVEGRDIETGTSRKEELQDRAREVGDKAREVTDRAMNRAREVTEEARERGSELRDRFGDQMSEATDQAKDTYRKVDRWLHDQVSERPVGTVMGAFAAGYIISAGLPRFVTRTLARVGLPLAAAGYLARMLSEGRFDDLMKGRERRDEGRYRPDSDVLITP